MKITFEKDDSFEDTFKMLTSLGSNMIFIKTINKEEEKKKEEDMKKEHDQWMINNPKLVKLSKKMIAEERRHENAYNKKKETEKRIQFEKQKEKWKNREDVKGAYDPNYRPPPKVRKT